MFESDVELSAEGERRRQSILHLARQQARRRHRRRVAMRFAGGAAAIVLAATLAMRFRFEQPVQRIVAVNHPVTSTAPAIVASSVKIEPIATDPAITSKLSIVIDRPKWQRLNDGELLTALADAGRPAGLIEVDGRTMLVPR